MPLAQPVRAEITVPGSKSITNRALILAALAEGEVTLEGALWSEDTQIMVECLQELGFMVDVRPDPNEFSNRTITVYGKGGDVPPGGTEQQPVELFVGNAGTAARFLAAFVCLGKGVYRLHGVPRMNERPKKALFQALRELGYRVDSPTEKLPAVIHGSGPKPGAKCTVNIEESSQFASALLLCAKVGGWNVEVIGEDAEESPYVLMTSKLIDAFPKRGGRFQIEPDASSGSYFWAAGKIAKSPAFMEFSEQFGIEVETRIANRISVAKWPDSGWQIDENFDKFPVFGSGMHKFIELTSQGKFSGREAAEQVLRAQDKGEISRISDLGDSIMTAIVMTAADDYLPGGVDFFRFIDLGRLRLQETERVVALRTELTKCGAKVIEEGDTLTVYPSKLHGAEIETYNDHRMAMCFAILGLKVPGIKLKNPACVKKTFPNFFQKLAGAPPHGLGATILDARSGRKLSHDELFAE
ncbi:MAG TPA: 3-phosphoshikimate 1-carboxyvinyltransferase [Verrucomicrobiae bacterium]|nr:3-phosphoshikimate 1-carboxyvinyltransferase [Verrucomicrobiae bacterium]